MSEGVSETEDETGGDFSQSAVGGWVCMDLLYEESSCTSCSINLNLLIEV